MIFMKVGDRNIELRKAIRHQGKYFQTQEGVFELDGVAVSNPWKNPTCCRLTVCLTSNEFSLVIQFASHNIGFLVSVKLTFSKSIVLSCVKNKLGVMVAGFANIIPTLSSPEPPRFVTNAVVFIEDTTPTGTI